MNGRWLSVAMFQALRLLKAMTPKAAVNSAGTTRK